MFPIFMYVTRFPQKPYSASSQVAARQTIRETTNVQEENIAQFGEGSGNVKTGEVTANMVLLLIK